MFRAENFAYQGTWFDAARMIFVSVASILLMNVVYSRRLDKMHEGRRLAEAGLAETETRYRELFDYSQGLICIHDLDGTLTTVNRAALNMLGYREEEMVGRKLSDFVNAERLPLLDAYMRQVMHEGLASGLLEMRSKSGKSIWLRYNNVLASEEGKEPYVLGHAQNVTELLEAQRQLKNLSLTDDLTGLYNRRGFMTLALQQVRLEMHKGTARGLGLLFADMDGLKAINDNHGHEAGSDAIVTLARLVKSTVRGADIVARWGGDEFVILTIGAGDENSQMMADRIKERLDQYNAESGKPYRVACSIGIAPVDLEGSLSLDEIIAQADKAMYADKKLRKTSPEKFSIPPGSKNSTEASLSI